MYSVLKIIYYSSFIFFNGFNGFKDRKLCFNIYPGSYTELYIYIDIYIYIYIYIYIIVFIIYNN